MKKLILISMISIAIAAGAQSQATQSSGDASSAFAGGPPDYAATYDTTFKFNSTGLPASLLGLNSGIGTCDYDQDFEQLVCRVTGAQLNSNKSVTVPSSAEMAVLSQGENPYLAVQSSGLMFFRLQKKNLTNAASNNCETSPICRLDGTNYPNSGDGGGITSDAAGNPISYDGNFQWALNPQNAPDVTAGTAYAWTVTKGAAPKIEWLMICIYGVVGTYPNSSCQTGAAANFTPSRWTSANLIPQAFGNTVTNLDPIPNCSGRCTDVQQFIPLNPWMSVNNCQGDGSDRFYACVFGLQQDNDSLVFIVDRVAGAWHALDMETGIVTGPCGTGTTWSCNTLTVAGAAYNNWPDTPPAAPALTAVSGGSLQDGHTYTVETELASQSQGRTTPGPTNSITVHSPNLSIQVATPGPTAISGTTLTVPATSVSRSNGTVTITMNASTLSAYAGVNMYIFVNVPAGGCSTNPSGVFTLKTATSSSLSYAQSGTTETNCNTSSGTIYAAKNFFADHYNVLACDSTGGSCTPIMQNGGTLTAPTITATGTCQGTGCTAGSQNTTFQIFAFDSAGNMSAGSNKWVVNHSVSGGTAFSNSNFISVNFTAGGGTAAGFYCVIGDGSGNMLGVLAASLASNATSCSLKVSSLAKWAIATNVIQSPMTITSLVTSGDVAATVNALGADLHNVKMEDPCFVRGDSSPVANLNGYDIEAWDVCNAVMVFASNLDNGTQLGMSLVGAGHGVQGQTAAGPTHINDFGQTSSFQYMVHTMNDTTSWPMTQSFTSSDPISNFDNHVNWTAGVNTLGRWPFCSGSYYNKPIPNAYNPPSQKYQHELLCSRLDRQRTYRFARIFSGGGVTFFSQDREITSPNGQWACGNSDGRVGAPGPTYALPSNAFTGVGNTMTVTFNNHPYSNGEIVVISGADGTCSVTPNVSAQITATTTNTFSFALTNAGSDSACGGGNAQVYGLPKSNTGVGCSDGTIGGSCSSGNIRQDVFCTPLF